MNRNIDSREWVTEALKFWTNTSPKACGASRKIIRWNIETLTAALKRLAEEQINNCPQAVKCPACGTNGAHYCPADIARD